MPTVQISDDIKALVGRLIADGAAANEVDVIETAVRRYAEDLDDTDSLLAAAEEGMAASRRGDTIIIAGPDDEAALHERLWARAMVLAEEMRAGNAQDEDESYRSGHGFE